jgi:hypothetical protein
MFGLGITAFIIIVCLAIAHRSNSFATGHVWFGVFIGLLIASVVPGLPNSVHDFVSNTVNNVANANTSK